MTHVQLTELDGSPILVSIDHLAVISPAPKLLWGQGAAAVITVDGRDIAVKENWEIILKRKWTGAE